MNIATFQGLILSVYMQNHVNTVWGGHFWHSSYYLRGGIVSAYFLDVLAFFRNLRVLSWLRHLTSALWDSMSASGNTPPKNRRVRSHRLGSVSSFFALFSHGFRVGLSEIMILCAPLRASETPHFRALSRLMRVALCAANDFPRTVFNLQSNVARAFQIGPHRPVNELESVCSKKNDKNNGLAFCFFKICMNGGL